jgi:hypothetical protein
MYVAPARTTSLMARPGLSRRRRAGRRTLQCWAGQRPAQPAAPRAGEARVLRMRRRPAPDRRDDHRPLLNNALVWRISGLFTTATCVSLR